MTWRQPTRSNVSPRNGSFSRRPLTLRLLKRRRDNASSHPSGGAPEEYGIKSIPTPRRGPSNSEAVLLSPQPASRNLVAVFLYLFSESFCDLSMLCGDMNCYITLLRTQSRCR